MPFKDFSEIDKKIYSVCYTGQPKTVYQVLAGLSDEGSEISYSYCCQRLGILDAKGYVKKIRDIRGRMVGYQSVDIDDVPYKYRQSPEEKREYEKNTQLNEMEAK